MLNFSWCALFYIKKFIKRKRCWYFNTKLWHLDSNARNRLVFVQLMIPSEITSNRADAKVFFGWANLSTWTFHRVKNGFKWSTPEKSHVNLLTWVAEVYLKSPECHFLSFHFKLNKCKTSFVCVLYLPTLQDTWGLLTARFCLSHLHVLQKKRITREIKFLPPPQVSCCWMRRISGHARGRGRTQSACMGRIWWAWAAVFNLTFSNYINIYFYLVNVWVFHVKFKL